MRLARAVRREIGQEHRYAHVLRVARLAQRLARAHGLDAGRARLAGMLHDLARLYSGERLLHECDARGIPVDAYERENPIVLHARLGAALARERFGVDDGAVLSAIAKHTEGDAEMEPLDAVLYLADGVEPGRAYADRAALEALAFTDLDAAMRASLRSSIAYLRERGIAVSPRTLAAARRYGLTDIPEERRPA